VYTRFVSYENIYVKILELADENTQLKFDRQTITAMNTVAGRR